MAAGCGPEDSELIRRYLVTRSTRLSTNSRRAYQADLSALANALESGLDGVTNEDLAAYLFERTRDPKDPDDPRPWGRRTANRKLAAFSGFYAWAKSAGVIDQDPTDELEVARFNRPAPVRLSQDQTDKLFSWLAIQCHKSGPLRPYYLLDHAFFRLCYHLALRVSEARDLRFSRMGSSGDDRSVDVVKKGDKIKPYPLAGLVGKALDEWLEVRSRVDTVEGHGDFVFAHPDTGRLVSRRRFSYHVLVMSLTSCAVRPSGARPWLRFGQCD